MRNTFPFPDKEASRRLFEEDLQYPKIKADRIREVFEQAWQIGQQEAERFTGCRLESGPIDMREILTSGGVKLTEREKDYVLGSYRYFCEYLSGRNLLFIYTKSVALWCEGNGFTYCNGLNIILCHEYFHYLEAKHIRQVSSIISVPALQLGRLSIGRVGVPSLSEVGANAFVNTCYKKQLLELEREHN